MKRCAALLAFATPFLLACAAITPSVVPAPQGEVLANVVAPAASWTMGHSFPKGAVPAGKQLACREGGAVQRDQAAHWPDGSTRFAVLSGNRAGVCGLVVAAPAAGRLAAVSGPVVTIELDLFEPQRSRIELGRFNGTDAPDNAGAKAGDVFVVTLDGHRFAHTVTAAQAGAAETAFTKLSDEVMKAIDSHPDWVAQKFYGSMYNRFVVERADGKPFTATVTTTGGAPTKVEMMTAARDRVRWTASNTGKPIALWLDGPIAREPWTEAPLTNAQGAAHPHLTARFGDRQYGAAPPSRHQVVLENAKTWAADPRNYTYDVRITVGGTVVLEEKARLHLHHARWSRTFGDPGLPARDWKYLRASNTVLNYAETGVGEDLLNRLDAQVRAADTSVTGHAQIQRGMPAAGGRLDIGPLTGWAAAAIMSQGEPRAMKALMAAAHGGMTAPMHYRDERTGLPVSIDAYPTITTYQTYASALPPRDPLTTASRWNIDNPHQPSLFYLPYILTGDPVWREQMHFWLVGSCLLRPPAAEYRDGAKCLMVGDEERAFAWYMRSLGHALAAAPADHPLHTHALKVWNHNIDALFAKWWNTPATAAGTPSEGLFPRYRGAMGSTAPWMADMNIMSFGLATMLELPRAREVLERGAKFAAARFNHEADGWCAVQGGGIYYARMHDAAGVPHPTWKALAEANKASMAGWPACASVLPAIPPGSYPVMARAALSIMADLGIAEAKTALAWHLKAADRVAATYRSDPTYAIVARR
jgi:hypothetical protein